MSSLVSIAMCTYNGNRFIKEQLDSILNQTYKNIELVIVDDGSEDNTIDIINQYVQKDSRIKVFQNEKNLGFVKNFEKAITLCKGDFIALADQDDIWKQNKIETFIENIGDSILIYSDAILIDDNSKLMGKELIRPYKNLIQGRCNKAFIFDNCVSGNTLMFKKELILYILPIPDKVTFHDGWIAFIASTIGTITFTYEPMIYYRRYSEQVTKSITRNYLSLNDRLKKKEYQYMSYSKNLMNFCLALKSIKFLDKEDIYILDILIEHCSNYKNGYFNFNLYKCLKKYNNEIFAIKIANKPIKYIIKYSMKNKLQKLFFYSL